MEQATESTARQDKAKWGAALVAAVVVIAALGWYFGKQQPGGGCPLTEQGERLLCHENAMLNLNTVVDGIYAELFQTLEGDAKVQMYNSHMEWSGQRRALLEQITGKIGEQKLLEQLQALATAENPGADCAGDAFQQDECAGWRLVQLYREELHRVRTVYPQQSAEALQQIAKRPQVTPYYELLTKQ